MRNTNKYWEYLAFDLMDMRLAPREVLTLHFNRLEAEAWLALDSDDCDLEWYAGSVLKHLKMMRDAALMLQLLPDRSDCEHAIELLTGKGCP